MFNFLEATLNAGASMTSTIIMLVIMFGIFYFMLIRPENKRKKEAEQMAAKAAIGHLTK